MKYIFIQDFQIASQPFPEGTIIEGDLNSSGRMFRFKYNGRGYSVSTGAGSPISEYSPEKPAGKIKLNPKRIFWGVAIVLLIYFLINRKNIMSQISLAKSKT